MASVRIRPLAYDGSTHRTDNNRMLTTQARPFPSPMDRGPSNLLTQNVAVLASRQLGFESQCKKAKAPNLYPQEYNITERLNNITLGNGLVGKVGIGRLRPRQTMVVTYQPTDSHASLENGLLQLLKIERGPGERHNLSPGRLLKEVHVRAGRPGAYHFFVFRDIYSITFQHEFSSKYMTFTMQFLFSVQQ